jgi:hypothetical protein
MQLKWQRQINWLEKFFIKNFNHPREIGFAFHGAGTNILSILRINPPKFGGGLKFEPDAGIGQKGAFCKGLILKRVYKKGCV